MNKCSFLMGPLLLAAASFAPAQTSSTALRASDLLDHPERYLNHSVDVDIVEPLSGPTSAAQLAASEYGQVEVRVTDSADWLYLVPTEFRPGDPNRFKHK